MLLKLNHALRLCPTRFMREFKRHKYDKRFAETLKKSGTDYALASFDDMYGKFYWKLWPSIRLALLSQPKHCALVNYYGDFEETIERLKELGCLDAQEIFTENQDRKQARKRPKLRQTSIGPSPEEPEEVTDVDEPAAEVESSASRIINPGEASSALHSFIPASKLKGMEDWVEEEDQLKYLQDDGETTINIKEELRLDFPTTLKAMVFPRGDISRFSPPKRGKLGTSAYYLMDAASLLPVLALGLQPEDKVLDMCAAPGGKSLAILQTLYPGLLVSNDVSPSRVNRIRNIMTQYLGSTQSWKGRLQIETSNALDWRRTNTFDKVLVDVPCTNDRHSANEDDNNMFKPMRIKDRVKLPETQSALLCSGIRASKPGGTIVYSTCSLSPIQNDGVVSMALKRAKQEHNIDVAVKDISEPMRHFKFMFQFAPHHLIRYGVLVVPSLVNNYGPMYICKLERLN